MGDVGSQILVFAISPSTISFLQLAGCGIGDVFLDNYSFLYFSFHNGLFRCGMRDRDVAISKILNPAIQVFTSLIFVG